MSRYLLVFVGLMVGYGCHETSPAPEPAEPKIDPRVAIAAAVTFTEGPTVHRDGSVFFSEMRTNRILRYRPDSRQWEVFREEARGANGLIFDDQNRLIACEFTPPQVTRTDLETGAVEVLADGFEGKRLNHPNDVTFDSQGRLYFSDRPEPNPEPDQVPVHAVYRIDRDGSIHQILAAPDIQMPNGLAISPDDETFYLIEAHPDEGRARMIRAYDLSNEGEVSNMRVFHDFYPGRSGDGMTIDSEGNLYVCAGLNRRRGTSETLDTKAGVHVFSPAGELVDFYPIEEDTITNAAFGGEDMKTLYVTAGKTLYEIRTETAGMRR